MAKLVLKGDLAKRVDFVRVLRAMTHPIMPLSQALIILNQLVDAGQTELPMDISSQDLMKLRALGVEVE